MIEKCVAEDGIEKNMEVRPWCMGWEGETGGDEDDEVSRA